MKEEIEIWKRKSSRQIADCRVFKVRQDFSVRDGEEKEHSFFVVENPDWVNVIGFTKDQKVILIEQFRHGIEEAICEIPGGMVDDGEDPIIAAQRELVEETGFAARKIIPLGKSRPNPAIQNNWIYHFLALDCEKTKETKFDENESIATKFATLDEVEEKIETGEISHSLVLAAFYKYAIHKFEIEHQ